MMFSIGGINLEIIYDTIYGNLEIERNYLPFLYKNSVSRQYTHCVDYTIYLNYLTKPTFAEEEKFIFRSTIWGFLKRNGLPILKIYNYDDGVVLREVELDHSSREIRVNILDSEYSSPGKLPWPLYYPMDELLFSNILSSGFGLRFHAFGTMIDGKGLLFAGNSGAGKSTLARIFSQDINYHGLSDDRIILRDRDRDFRIYGTPWCGDFKLISAASSILKKLFIIRHGTQNQLIPMTGIDAISRLLTVSFPPLWDERGMEYTIFLLERLAENVECFELAFKPDEDIIRFISEIVQHN